MKSNIKIMKKLLLLVIAFMTFGISNAQVFKVNQATAIYLAPDSAATQLKVSLKKDSLVNVSDYTRSGWALCKLDAQTKGYVRLSVLTPTDEKAQRIVDGDPLLRSSYKNIFIKNCIYICLIALATGFFALFVFKRWQWLQVPVMVLAILTISCTQLTYYWHFDSFNMFDERYSGILAFIVNLIGHTLFLLGQTFLFYLTLGKVSYSMTFGKGGVLLLIAFVILFLLVLIVLFALDLFAVTYHSTDILLKWSWLIFSIFLVIQVIMLFIQKVIKERISILRFISFTCLYIIGLGAILIYGSDVIIALIIALIGGAILSKTSSMMIDQPTGNSSDTMGQWVRNTDGRKVFKQVEKGKHYQQ